MKALITFTRATCGPPGPGLASRVLGAIAHAAMMVLFLRRIARAIAQFEALLDLWRTAGPQIPTPAVRDGLHAAKTSPHHLATVRAEPAARISATAPSAPRHDRLVASINNTPPAASHCRRAFSSPHGPASRVRQNHPNPPQHPRHKPRQMPLLPPMRSFQPTNLTWRSRIKFVAKSE